MLTPEYAKKVLYNLGRTRFLRGRLKARIIEKLIKAENGYLLLSLAHALRRRLPRAEPLILKSPSHSSQYARLVLKAKWPEGEATIIKGPTAAAKYAVFLKHPWPEAERTIARVDDAAILYAEELLVADPDEWQLSLEQIGDVMYEGSVPVSWIRAL